MLIINILMKKTYVIKNILDVNRRRISAYATSPSFFCCWKNFNQVIKVSVA